ncbi:MAG: Uma2 family endonuclease [Isosphaeraceae bacterium]
MATLTTHTPTLADLLDQLGDVPPSRVLMRPAPGQATEADVLTVNDREGRLCELVDGVLVEKAMGFRESILAGLILSLLRAFVIPGNLGLVSGADGLMRLFPGLVRTPDVAFASWDRVPGRSVPSEPIPDLVPDLAVEVLSKSNTKRELTRKLREYFEAGVRLVWLVDPQARTVAVHAPRGAPVVLDASETLDGGEVLPGFVLSLADLFAELDRHG